MSVLMPCILHCVLSVILSMVFFSISCTNLTRFRTLHLLFLLTTFGVTDLGGSDPPLKSRMGNDSGCWLLRSAVCGMLDIPTEVDFGAAAPCQRCSRCAAAVLRRSFRAAALQLNSEWTSRMPRSLVIRCGWFRLLILTAFVGWLAPDRPNMLSSPAHCCHLLVCRIDLIYPSCVPGAMITYRSPVACHVGVLPPTCSCPASSLLCCRRFGWGAADAEVEWLHFAACHLAPSPGGCGPLDLSCCAAKRLSTSCRQSLCKLLLQTLSGRDGAGFCGKKLSFVADMNVLNFRSVRSLISFSLISHLYVKLLKKSQLFEQSYVVLCWVLLVIKIATLFPQVVLGVRIP